MSCIKLWRCGVAGQPLVGALSRSTARLTFSQYTPTSPQCHTTASIRSLRSVQTLSTAPHRDNFTVKSSIPCAHHNARNNSRFNCKHAFHHTIVRTASTTPCEGLPPSTPPSAGVVQLHGDDLVDENSEVTAAHRAIIDSFPSGISFACTYGSAAFEQVSNTATKETMLDFIIAVDNPLQWHENNLSQHPHHYSALMRFAGANTICRLSNIGANIYYNSHIQHQGRLIKYGVISTADLIKDLTHWSTLYTAGRLHKPVRVITCTDDVARAYVANLVLALRVSTFLLPKEFSERDLFLEIAGLSYSGDPRMVVGENKNKVQNIVDAQIEAFRNLYTAHLWEGGITVVGNVDCDGDVDGDGSGDGAGNGGDGNNDDDDDDDDAVGVVVGGDIGVGEQQKLCLDEQSRKRKNWWLPQHLLHKSGATSADATTITADQIRKSVQAIVRPTSTRQALVGLISADPGTVFKYVGAKLGKMFQGGTKSSK